MEYKSRKQAIEDGDSHYFLGSACPKNHVSKRRVSNGACVECEKIKSKIYRQRPENRDKVKQWSKKSYEKHKEKRLEYARKSRIDNAEHISWKRKRQRHWIAYIKMMFGCETCGYKRNSYALDFNHMKDSKVKDVSSMVGCSPKTIIKEIRKCQVLCANCHREYTANQLNLSVIKA